MSTNHLPVSPWSYVITLYLPFGILTGLMSGFPIGLFKLLAFPNETIGMLNGIGLVVAFRFLYAGLCSRVIERRWAGVDLIEDGVHPGAF